MCYVRAVLSMWLSVLSHLVFVVLLAGVMLSVMLRSLDMGVVLCVALV